MGPQGAAATSPALSYPGSDNAMTSSDSRQLLRARGHRPPPVEVRARPLLAALGIPTMLKARAPQLQAQSMLRSSQAISLHDRS